MNDRELDILENAFETEIKAALTGSPGVYQTRSKLARKLVEEGYLSEQEIAYGRRMPIMIRGYVLTDLGRLTYCTSDRCTE